MKNLPKTGFISQVLMQLPHVFQSFMDQYTRFQFFIDKVLPQYRDVVMSHTLIYIPSYFNYVQMRNYLHKEELNCTQICEYSQEIGSLQSQALLPEGREAVPPVY
ncbi:U3 small nucleolar RNA-associated protein 25 homolog [Acipenser ruthenus]|uniref:U3 small nucleolar RNA-associated protein 25 homolog n=1 Tax=Acipenser ruthenus TaxID=7906 RepID=UPI002742769C|nr:U3 small nucleolar RNA-associated protein 25 homolog [Acipenser ruthenus]